MNLTNTDSVARAFLGAFAPPPATTIDEWAEANRYLPTETAADAGQWRNEKTPWLVEIMRELSPTSRTQTVVFMSSARIGKTETLNNTVGFFMDAVKCPIMVAQPIEADAEEWSKDHLDPMIAHTPSLSRLVTADKDRRKGNTILHKKYMGGVVYCVGATSGKSFRRRTIRVGLGDELDAWPGTIDGEGDPWLLFCERTSTFPFAKKLGAFSTPTIRGQSRVESLFLTSDQRYWHVPCPFCGLYQRLVFSRLRHDGGTPAEYLCDPEIGGCGSLIPEHKRDGMVSRGRWVATFPGRPVAGFQISQIYSPWVTWSALGAAWASAQGDPLQLQVFTNTKLGETYDLTDGDQWDPDSLMQLREALPQLPARVVLITASVDTQGDRLVLQIDAWGPGEERWTLDRQDLIGDPTEDPSKLTSVWAELDRILLETTFAHPSGKALRIRACGVDTGGNASAQAYKFCRARRSRRVWALKGDHGREGSDLWPKTPSRRNKGNLPLHLVGVFAGKESCMSRLKASMDARKRGERGGPGYWHFAAVPSIGPSYFEELTAEACIVAYAGTRGGRATSERRRRWVKREADLKNEALDCSVYSYAVLHGLMALGVRLDRGKVDASAVERVEEIGISSRIGNLTKREEIPSPPPASAPAPPPPPPRKPPGKRPRWS